MKRNIVRQIYLYAVSIVSLFMIVFSTSSLLKLGLQAWVFPKAGQPYNSCGDLSYGGPYPAKPTAAPDGTTTTQMTDDERAKQKTECEKNLADQRASDTQRELVQNISLLIVAIPLFWFHFRIVQREREEDKELVKKEV